MSNPIRRLEKARDLIRGVNATALDAKAISPIEILIMMRGKSGQQATAKKLKLQYCRSDKHLSR